MLMYPIHFSNGELNGFSIHRRRLIWEASGNVKSVIVGTQVLDDGRLHTLFCEVQAVINSRPITPASENPHDLDGLTPNHLLRAGAHNCLPLGGQLKEEHYRWR